MYLLATLFVLLYRAAGQAVTTTSGVINGHAASWPANSSVIEFLGIPYAHPPLGELRFAPPQSYKSNESFTASKYSADCMQYIGGLSTNITPSAQAYGYAMGGGSPQGLHAYSEDCLTINVWTKTSHFQKSKAVLMWIYGGGFTSGTSNAPFYNGARLVEEEDVVVVSFNYRVNLFGFPNAPGLTDRNLGFLDQRLAVEWVRDNIAAFGGDPERITLFGESAGGASADYYAYAWKENPIVKGLVAQSGTALIGENNPQNLSSTSAWFNLTSAVGCGGEEVGNGTVVCMRKKSAEELINAYGKTMTSAIGGFGPIADGKLVFSDVRERARAGNFAKLPLLVGINDNELGITIALPGSLGPSIPPEFFPLANAAFADCPSSFTAKTRATNNVPVWRYRYMPVWPNTALAPGIGAYHSSEIPLVFGTTEVKLNASKDTAEEAALSKMMRKAWTSFAKDPRKGLLDIGWPVYQPNGTTLIRLGYNNHSELNFGPSEQYDTLCVPRNLTKISRWLV